MSKLLVIGGNDELTRRLEAGQPGRRSRLTVTRRDWSAVRRRPAALSDADILLVDLTAPDAYTARGLANLQSSYPRLPLMLQTDADLSHSNALTRLLEKPTVDFVRSSADADEVRQRIRRLLNLRRHEPPTTSQTASGPIARFLVPELHHPETGRLDSRRVAEFFGISLAEVARALGKSLSAVHKTSNAASLQEGLFVFERVAVALLTLVGSKEASRAWLHLPENQLAGKTPLSVLLEGRGHLVADMLDDMMLGQPS